jgi:hypothetical protein
VRQPSALIAEQRNKALADGKKKRLKEGINASVYAFSNPSLKDIALRENTPIEFFSKLCLMTELIHLSYHNQCL